MHLWIVDFCKRMKLLHFSGTYFGDSGSISWCLAAWMGKPTVQIAFQWCTLYSACFKYSAKLWFSSQPTREVKFTVLAPFPTQSYPCYSQWHLLLFWRHFQIKFWKLRLTGSNVCNFQTECIASRPFSIFKQLYFLEENPTIWQSSMTCNSTCVLLRHTAQISFHKTSCWPHCTHCCVSL